MGLPRAGSVNETADPGALEKLNILNHKTGAEQQCLKPKNFMKRTMCWRDGSMVTRVRCSSRGPKFGLAAMLNWSQLPMTLAAYGTHSMFSHRHVNKNKTED